MASRILNETERQEYRHAMLEIIRRLEAGAAGDAGISDVSSERFGEVLSKLSEGQKAAFHDAMLFLKAQGKTTGTLRSARIDLEEGQTIRSRHFGIPVELAEVGSERPEQQKPE